MISRSWARMAFALLALVCLVAFTLPDTAQAKPPTGKAQVNQENISASTAADAGYQHTVTVTTGMEVDIGARAATRAQTVLTTPAQGYALASGRAATNELRATVARYAHRPRDGSQPLRRPARE